METFIQFSTDYTAETAPSVRDAIDLLARPEGKKFDCFLMDIQMPGTDGIEFCKYLRNRSDYKRSLILMLTAMSEKSYLDRAFAAGADDYITKPFEIGDLRERLGLRGGHFGFREKHSDFPRSLVLDG
ncbi:response regulator [Roseovarius faecimaris]|uniref:response regulator n=1 Tax=Roseovarius faecimaris TaxID=2494550 RepID=UPI0012FD05D8|nr:response regulator [Roseovarius faecimaris]